MSHLGPSLLFMQHVLSSLKFPSTFGFFNIISLSHYPCINWLTGELNLKSQNLFLLQIFWVVLISHFVPDFIQVCDLPFFFFLIAIFHCAPVPPDIKPNTDRNQILIIAEKLGGVCRVLHIAPPDI